MGRCESCGKATVKNKENVSFHRFPTESSISEIWVKNMGRVDWKPRKDSVLCSTHFKPECFYRTGRMRLVRGSVPTIFQTEDKNLQNVDINTCNSTTEKTKLNHVEVSVKSKFHYEETIDHEDSSINTNGESVIERAINLLLSSPDTTVSARIPTDNESWSEEIIGLTKKMETTPLQLPTVSTSVIDSTPQTKLKIVTHDHTYGHAESPRTMSKKLFSAERKLALIRKNNKVLKQRVKRLKLTVDSLKIALWPTIFETELAVLAETAFKGLQRLDDLNIKILILDIPSANTKSRCMQNLE